MLQHVLALFPSIFPLDTFLIANVIFFFFLFELAEGREKLGNGEG